MVLGQELFRRIYADDSADETHNWLAVQMQKLAGGDDSARMMWDDSFDVYEQIMQKRREQAALPESERHILTWPWPSWSNLLDPLDPGLLAVLSAADGGGKSLYAENLAEHWARCGMNVVFILFELNRSLMLDRRMARQSGIPRRDLKAGTMGASQVANYERANERLRAYPGSITYVHTPGWTMERAMGEVSALAAEDICDVFIVDYLEKAAPSGRQLKAYGNNVFAREADQVEVVKRTAEVIERPALLLAQLSKMGKKQSFNNLDLTAIRGAGEKTERANIVILLHRENSESQIVKGRVDKNTMGRCGTFEQFMEGARFLVTDIQPDDQMADGGMHAWENKY